MLHQYQIVLGNVDDSGFNNNPLLWIYYLITTVFTSITFFNMLISIMDQSFGTICETRERCSLMERTKMYADFIWMLKFDAEIFERRYLYIVRPLEDEDESAVASGIIEVKRTLKKLETKITNQLQN